MREKTDRYREREREKRNLSFGGVTIVRRKVLDLVHFSDRLLVSFAQRIDKIGTHLLSICSVSSSLL